MATDWLKGLGDVLRADTGDLRRLAEIAGEDPATLYIGTAMDGADLRGQDLRGMRFTHLDLKKVRCDASTMFDPPRVEPREYDAGDLQALVYLKTEPRRPYPRTLRSDIGPGIGFFAADEEDEFRRACQTFPGPKFVALEHSRRHGLRDLLDSYRPDVLTLVVRYGPARTPNSEDLNAAREALGPVVIVPSPSLARRQGAPLLSGAGLDALLLFTANWREVPALVRPGELSVFFRARGSGPESRMDAWCRLLSTVVRSDLIGSEGVRLVPRHTSMRDDEAVSEALFETFSSRSVKVVGGLVRSVEAAILVRPGAGRHHPKMAYAEAISRVLELKKWRLPRSVGDGAAFRLEGRAYRPKIHIWGRLEPHIGRSILEDRAALDVPLGASTLIVASEVASDAETVASLIENNWLFVTAGDLLQFEPTSASIWPLVAVQARRLVRSAAPLVRTLYLSVLIAAALRDERLADGNATALVEAFRDPNFAHVHRLDVVRIRHSVHIVSLRVRLLSEPGLDRDPPVLEFDLNVDQTGPWLANFAAMSAFEAGWVSVRSS